MKILQRIMAEAKIVKPKVLIISGTTAVGKTDLSILLARKLGGEIISADSAQVFRGLDVGSAKVEPQLQEEIPHHMIDVVGVKEKFSAGEFRDRAMKAIQDIHLRQKLPIIVGGTSLYIKMFLEGCSGAPSSTPDGQAKVDDVIKGKSWDESVQHLATLDQDYASKLEVNDWYRLRRALEICLVSGKAVSSFKMEVDLEKFPFQCKCLFLTMPRERLYRRIDLRCEKIIQGGIFKEVVDLLKHGGLSADSQPGRCIGYRQTLEYLRDVWKFPQGRGEGHPHPLQQPEEENADMEKMFLEFLYHYQAETRQLAKSQMVWHRREPYFQWVDMNKMVDVARVADAVADWVTNDQGFPHELDGAHLKELNKGTREEMRKYITELQVYNKRENILEALEEIRRLVS